MPWYAVHVASNHEHLVRDALNGLAGPRLVHSFDGTIDGKWSDLPAFELEVYLPLYRERRKWRGARQIVEIPVFRGYVFVRCNLTSRLHIEMLKLTGVVKLLGGPKPETIPDEQVNVVQIMMTLPATRRDDGHRIHLAKGSDVRVKCGPLAGCAGKLLYERGKALLVVSVDLLGQSIKTTIAAEDVEPLLKAA